MNIQHEKTQAKIKALDSLAHYKFMMFGYHAALWVTLNHLDTTNEHSPFTSLVNQARLLRKGGL